MHNNSPENMPEVRPSINEPVAREKLEGGKAFVLHTDFSPAGDQPTAIAELTNGVNTGERDQVLLGAAGTGKTHTTIGSGGESCGGNGAQGLVPRLIDDLFR